MRLGFAIAVVCMTSATTLAGDDDFDLPGLDAPDLRGDALVWEDATLYIEPWDGGAALPKFSYLGRRRDDPGRAMPVRIIDSTMRNFVEVVAPGRADCSWRRLAVDPRVEGLRFYVKRSDLAPVLVKPYAMQHPDGTRIKLGIGFPVTPAGNGEYMVSLRNDKVRLSIPHGSIGYIYKAPAKIPDPEIPKTKVVRIDQRTNMKLGEDSIQVRSSWYAPIPDKKTDTALVKLGVRCGEAVVSVMSTALRRMDPPRPRGPRTLATPPATGWRIPAGAPLMTPGGREVAVAAKDIAVTMPSPAPATVCFNAQVAMMREDETYYGTQYQRSLRLCAPGSVVEK